MYAICNEQPLPGRFISEVDAAEPGSDQSPGEGASALAVVSAAAARLVLPAAPEVERAQLVHERHDLRTKEHKNVTN